METKPLPNVAEFEQAVQTVIPYLLKVKKTDNNHTTILDIVEKANYKEASNYLKKFLPNDVFVKVEYQGLYYGLICVEYSLRNNILGLMVEPWAEDLNSEEYVQKQMKRYNKGSGWLVVGVIVLILILSFLMSMPFISHH